MTKILSCGGVCILFVSLLVSDVYCQEDDESSGGSGGSWWSGLTEAIRNLMNEVRKSWNEFTKEIRERTSDMRGWTREMFDTFKQTMRDWVNGRNDISSAEKNDMRNYIERLQMPTEEPKRE